MQGVPALARDAVATGGGISGLRLTVDVPSTTTGVTSVRFGDVPPSEIPERTAPTETAPIGKSPIGKSPIGKSPIGKSPIGKSPIGKSPIGKSPIGKSPIGKSPIGKSPILDASLAAFPLLREGGWTTILAHTCSFSNRDRTTCPKVVANEVATATPQSVTWAQLLADPFARDGDPTTLPELDPGSPEALRLDEIIWALSPMRDVSFLSFLMGVTTWEGVAPPEGGWCAEWVALGKSCSAGDLRRTIFEAESDGLPIERTSLPDTPFGALADPAGTLFWLTTIIDTNIAGSSLGDIRFGDIANLSGTVDCSGGYCSDPAAPLRRAADDRRILDTATFADLGMSALGSLSLAAIEYAFLDPAALDWEGIPLEDITFERLPPPSTTFVRYTLSYSVDCVDADGMRATVDLPDGFRYRPGSSRFDTDPLIPGDTAVPDPVRSAPGDREGPLEWDLAAFACNGAPRTFALSFEVMPGFEAGTFASSATVDTATTSASVNDAAPVAVAGGLSTTSIAQPYPATTGSLVVGHIEDIGDRAYVEFTIDPAGAPSPTDDITVTLSHLERNYDLVVYAPDGSDTERSLRSTPPEPVPFGKGPAADPAHEGTFDLRPEALQDVPIESSKVVAGVSALPGTEMESLTIPAVSGADGSTTYTVQVSGNNGAHGPQPFVLSIRSSVRQTLPPCEPRTFPFAPVLPPDPLDPILGDVGNDGPPIVGSGVDSLILVHSRRLAAVFGPVEAARILSELADLEEAAPTLGFNAQVVDLALFRPVEVAYAAADADPCSTDLANDVVRAINDAVDGLATPLNDNLADLRWITLVGDDDQIPHARLRDGTTIGNERGFAGDTFFADPTTGEARSNQYSAAFATGHYLSDAPYGSFRPVSIFGQTIYPMQVAVGRLGGSASTITNAIRLFVASGGVADPETATPRPALVGDYDFATDGGDRIEAALTADGLAARRLRGAWTRDALTEALFGGGQAPDVIAVNAHYDQHRLLPGAGDAGTWTDEDLFTTADVAAAASDAFQLRVLFGIGCHFGLGFPDRLAGSTPSATDAARVLDWQQAYVDKGAAALIANLGYGYGDTSAVGYSEQLMASLADNLADSPTIGEALTLAERDYLLSMGSFSAYDVKTVQQAILWGLPMYRLSSGPLEPAPNAASPDAHGLTDAGSFDTMTVDLTPTFEDVLAPGGHVYRRVTGNDVSCSTSSCVADRDEGVQVTHPYPIVPRSVVRLPGADGASARGAAMLGVPVGETITPTTPRTEIEATDLDIAYARATIDSSTIDPPRTAPGIYPATPQAITTFIDRDGATEQRLVVLPGQYRPAPGPGPGVFRTFVTSRWLVTYSADGDTTPPQIVEVVADPIAGRTRFSVTVRDPGNGDADPVVRVGVNALPLGGDDPNVYRLLDLERDAAVDGRWVGTMPFNVREFVAFAIDSHGNVANATNSGAAYAAVDDEPPRVALAIGTPKVTGADETVIVRASTPLSVTVGDDGTGLEACTIEVSGGATASPACRSGDTAFTMPATSGDYTIRVSATDVAGNVATRTFAVRVDETSPTIDVTSPRTTLYTLGEHVTAEYTCSDEGAGIASCIGDLASGSVIPTLTVGSGTFTVAATDALGNRASRSVGYVVGYGVCLLYDPNQPVKLTTSTIPIKLQLCDPATRRNLSAPSIGLTATRLVKVVNGTETQVKLDPNSGTGTTVFRYDPQLGVTGGYIYNLQTKTLAPVSKYRLYFTIDAEPALPDGSRAERIAAFATR